MDKMKRYIVKVDMYVWAEDDKAAISKGRMIAEKQREMYDNQCALLEVVEQPFGTLGCREVYNVEKN